MLTDEQVSEIVETTYPCEWETDYDPCNPTCALCLKRSTCALLTDRAALEAEVERLRAVADGFKSDVAWCKSWHKGYPQKDCPKCWWNDGCRALAALGEEATDE